MSGSPRAIGVSLAAWGKRSGTAFYTEQLLRVLSADPNPDFSIVPIVSSAMREELPGRFELRKAGRLPPRWPFRFAAAAVSKGMLAGLDAVHYPNGVGPPQRKVPIIATIHDVSPFLCPETLPFSRALYLRRMFSAVAERACLILADTKWQSDRIREVFPEAGEKLRVVAPTVDPIFGQAETTRLREPTESNERDFLLMVGTLEPRKNIAPVIEAWRRSEFNADLHLIGRWGWKTGTLWKALRSLGPVSREGAGSVWSLPDGRRARQLGFVSKSELARAYRQALCLIAASRFEGFCLPVLEAMKSGCPVVTRRDNAMEEVAAGSAWYFDPENPGSLETTLRALAADERARSERIAAGQARARQFGDDAFREGILRSYREATG